MVRRDVADRIGHRPLDPQPVPVEHDDGPALRRQQPLTVLQADDEDADLRSLAEQLADAGERSQPREPSSTTTIPGPEPTPR